MKMRYVTLTVMAFAASVGIWGLTPLSTEARTDPPPLDAYGALPALEFVEISPSGERLVSVSVEGERRAMLVTDLSTGAILGGVGAGETKVREVEWVGEDRIVATISSTQAIPLLGAPRSELYFGRIYEIGSRKLIPVFDRTPGVLPILIGPAQVRETADGPAIFVRGFAPDVYRRLNLFRIDPTNGRGQVALEANVNVEDLVLNAQGAAIARSQYDGPSRRWSLHLPSSGRMFRGAWFVDAPVDLPALMGMGRGERTIIVSALRPDLVTADGQAQSDTLFEVDIDSGEWRRLPFVERVDFLVHHPRTRLLLGAGRMTDEGVKYEFLDEGAKARWAQIERAFAGRSPRLTSWTADMKGIVIFTEGNGDSGVYHYVNFDRRRADIVGEAYPAITPDQVGPMRPISYKAADGLTIHGYLTTPPGVENPAGLPLVVLAHGGPASRDAMGFDWWAQALASRGYAVLQANFRGSTGYGESFLEAGYGEWGRKMQTDLSDGVRWLAAEGVIDPARVCIAGASYGGYAALAGPTLDKGVYRCAVSVAGVSDLRRMVSWVSERGAMRDNEVVRYWNRFMGAERTGDRALDERSPARLAGEADAPILLLHGRDDTVVPIEQSRIMAEAMRRTGKPVELIELSGEDHWMSRADTRQQMLRETVRFLEAHNPVD
jgi:dipeptidyl aminopeptidase/acylaminoacyl peptidase